MSCRRVETENSGYEMISEYYFPFIAGDYVHAGRTGGNAFYCIEGINSSETKPSSFVFPNVRMSRNEGTDTTFGLNNDTSFPGIDLLGSTAELEKKLSLSSGVTGNTGCNTSSGYLTQTVVDINGDSIPDIIQKTDSGIKVFAGKKSDTASDISLCYPASYEIGRIQINSTSSSMQVKGASISPGGSVSLEFKKGKVSHVKSSAGTSGGCGNTLAEGYSRADSGLIDINGDGLSDYFDGSQVLLNTGNEFKSSKLISVPSGSMNSSYVKSLSVNVSQGKTSTNGESLMTGVSSGIGLSYSVSSNTTEKMFLDINGDGLCDRLEQDGSSIRVLYNTGSSFVNAETIYLPPWNLDGSQKKSLATEKDVNFELSQFSSLPLIGPLTQSLVNRIPVYNPFSEDAERMEFSSSISLGVSGNIGVNFTFPIKIPAAAVSVNMTCSGGNGLSGSTSINAVNVSMTDLDGDALPDHVLRIPGFKTYWKRNISGRYGQLTKINLPQGGHIKIEYEEKYGTTDNPNFKYVMSAVTIDDGCKKTVPEIYHGEHSVTTHYEYDGGYYERHLRDFFGFEKVTSTFADGTYCVEKYYNRDYYSKGCIAESHLYTADGTLLSESFTELCESPVALPEREESRTYEKSSGSGNVICTVAEYEYDEYGSCTKVTQDFGDGESLTGEIIYDNSNVADYIIGLPVDIRVYDSDGNLLRHRSGSYDGTGQLTELRQYFDSYNWSSNFLSYDNFGNIKRISDSRDATLSYTYDEDENMFVTEISQGGKNTDTYKSKIDYDIATQTKTREIDCNGNTLRYEYDGLNRLIRIDYPDTEDTVYTYGTANDTHGAAGKILSVTDASGTLEYEYGALGEVIKETRTLATHLNGRSQTETAVMEYRSDYLGRMQWIVYPDGEKITYGYDRGGQVISVKGEHWGHDFDYVTNILYDEYGQRTRIDFGNGTFTEYNYDPARRWLDTIKTQNKWGQCYQNITYSFDAVGNVLGYENDCLDNTSGNYKTRQIYSYDNLYQLIKVDGETTYNPYKSSSPEFVSNYSQLFEFDADGLGNMTSKVSKETVTPKKSIGDNLNYSFDYVYDENYAHRLVRAGDRYYKYDSNGNIICEQDGSFDGTDEPVTYHKVTQEAENVYSTDYGWGLFKEDDGSSNASSQKRYKRTYTWDEKNQLISSVDANYSTAYIYGQDGQRSNKYTQSSETLYFNKMWTLHTDSGNSVYGGQSAKNIYLGETRIVTKLNSGTNPTYQEEYYKQYFYHSDHLGSASLISDYKGDEYQRIEYTPYGETWVEKTANTGLEFLPYKFTAKELDEETGLYYYGARYLDSKYSRWISTDPALGEYIPKAPINEEAKRHNQNLPGLGGVFNTVNANLYHYASNNPVRYIDPDGKIIETAWDAFNVALDLTSLASNMMSGNFLGAAFDLASLLYDGFATATPCLPGGTGSAKLIIKLSAEYGDDAAKLVLRYADDVAEIIFKGGNSRKLGNNIVKALGLSCKPAGTAAHHIVAGGSKFAKDARKILAKFHIDINDAANGVFLDTAKHAGLHTKEYYLKVQNLLETCKSKEDVLNTLKYIAQKLTEGAF